MRLSDVAVWKTGHPFGKAVVYQGDWWDNNLRQVITGYEAWHECASGEYWTERKTAWHNAFWAADHHMRYDCGRREPSSGDAYEAVRSGDAYEVGCMESNTPVRYVLDLPVDKEDPLPPASAEDPTVELGAITTELGPLPGMQWEGSTGDAGVGSAGWWARVRGKRHAG